MNQTTARMTHQQHLPQPQKQDGQRGPEDRSGQWAGWIDGFECGGGTGDGDTEIEHNRDIGQSGDERDAAYALCKEEKGTERALLSFIKKYRGTEVT